MISLIASLRSSRKYDRRTLLRPFAQRVLTERIVSNTSNKRIFYNVSMLSQRPFNIIVPNVINERAIMTENIHMKTLSRAFETSTHVTRRLEPDAFTVLLLSS